MTIQEKVLYLVETLPEEKLPEAERLLQGLMGDDPLLALLATAPDDDEPYTKKEQGADTAAWERYQRGARVPHEEVLRRARSKAS